MSNEVKHEFELKDGEYLELKIRSPERGRDPDTDIPLERETYINGDAPGRFKLVKERSSNDSTGETDG